MAGEFKELAAKLAENGYSPVPIRVGEKRPKGDGWQNYKFKPEDVLRNRAEGVGLLTRGNPAVDIDISNAALVDQISALAREIFGAAPCRVGNDPRCLLMYRTETPFDKMKSREFKFNDEPLDAKANAIEILSNGQQFVAYAVHPDTHKPYRWTTEKHPTNLKADALRSITEAQVKRFLAEAEKIIEARADVKFLSPLARAVNNSMLRGANGELAAREPAKCALALASIPNDNLSYDDWMRVMMMCKGALGEKGLPEFLKFSAKCPTKHNEQWATTEYLRCAPTKIGAGAVFAVAGDHGWRDLMFHADLARVGDLRAARPKPAFIYDGYLPFGTVGGLPAEGGAGKTTFTLYEGIHIVTGREFCGMENKRKGSVLFVTAEDERALMVSRLKDVCDALLPELTDEERTAVEQGIYIEDISGKMLRLVEADERGNLERTRVGDYLIDAYRDKGIVLINFDPTNLLGPGERYVNDAEASLMVEGLRISKALGCSSRYVHHVAKTIARGTTVDQYHGRGGSAFADNSRFQHTLMVHRPDPRSRGDDEDDGDGTSGEFTPPSDIDALALREGRVLRLHITKMSWGKRLVEPIWLERDGWTFKAFAPATEARSRSRVGQKAERELKHKHAVLDYIRAKLQAGVKLSATELAKGHNARLGFKIGRDPLAALVSEMLQQRHLKLEPLPENETQGRRRDYLSAGDVALPPMAVPEIPNADGTVPF